MELDRMRSIVREFGREGCDECHDNPVEFPKWQTSQRNMSDPVSSP